METLGSLVDKLTTVNLKLWHVQAWVHYVQEQTPEDFKKQQATEVHEKIVQLGVLNKQRNQLMTEIDKLSGGPVEERVKL